MSPPPASRKVLRILLIGAQRLTLESLHTLLQKRSDFSVVDIVETATEARTVLRVSSPELLLVDVDQPHGVDHRLALDLRCRYAHIPLLALTLYTDPHSVRHLLLGDVQGCLTKDTAPAELFAAIHTIAEGGSVFSPAIRTAMQQIDTAEPPVTPQLTLRERDVLYQLLRGRRAKKIAKVLHLQEQTVRNYLQSIYEKFGVHSRGDLLLQLGSQRGRKKGASIGHDENSKIQIHDRA